MTADTAGAQRPPLRRWALPSTLGVVAVFTSLFVVAPVRGYTPSDARVFATGNEYLALGDSLATGVGSSRCPVGCAGRSGYVADFARRLEGFAGHAVSVRDLGVSGETTNSFIGDYFSNPDSRSQLARAVAEIRNHGAGIGPVTLDIGGNDALNVHGSGHSTAAKLAALATLRTNLETIVSKLESELRAADSTADLVLLAYYEPFGDADSDLWAMGRLNQTILDIAAEHGLRVAEPYAAFAGVEQQTTWMSCKCIINIHPNDRGYALLGDALAAVTIAPETAAGSLVGVVRNEAGSPATGVRVWYGGGSVVTDVDGAYRVDDVPAGMALHFAAGDEGDRVAAASVTLRPGQSAIQNFVLSSGLDAAAEPSGSTRGAAGFARIGAAIVRAAAHAAAQGARDHAAAGMDQARAGAAAIAGRAAAGIERLRQLPIP
ncbi:MAG TPA: GDSL-type esterase/lipase family protein [Dehalococcoidia bacterium]|nr:GDSL-type esterase/lipase family protein [Dehalococcoidia bacterium]